jgi:hypothetical protein
MLADAAPARSARLSKGHLKHPHTYALLNKHYLIAWHRIPARPALERLLISLRANGVLVNNFRPIWVIQSPTQKYSAFHPTQISGFFGAVPSRQEGRIARRHERGTGCGGREGAGAEGGRRVS